MSSGQLDGNLYSWVFDGIFPYVKFSPPDNNDTPILVDSISPELGGRGPHVLALAFAPYSPLVAYLTIGNHTVDLWLADLTLEQVQHLWQAEGEWFEALSMSAPGLVYLQWGPSERSLLLSSFDAPGYWLIYSLATNRPVEGIGTCNTLAPLPELHRLTLWCFFGDASLPTYLYWGKAGDIHYAERPPETPIEVLAWAFAPDDRLAYIPIEGNLTVINGAGHEVAFPIHLEQISETRTVSYLQWSARGDRLLVYGFHALCPAWRDRVFGDLVDRACWLVLDVETGNILWWPDERIAEAARVPLEDLSSRCAGFSPEADWLAICYHDGAIHFLLLVSLPDRRVINFSSIPVLNFKWAAGFYE